MDPMIMFYMRLQSGCPASVGSTKDEIHFTSSEDPPPPHPHHCWSPAGCSGAR